jgi:hypothetical protein
MICRLGNVRCLGSAVFPLSSQLSTLSLTSFSGSGLKTDQFSAMLPLFTDSPSPSSSAALQPSPSSFSAHPLSGILSQALGLFPGTLAQLADLHPNTGKSYCHQLAQHSRARNQEVQQSARWHAQQLRPMLTTKHPANSFIVKTVTQQASSSPCASSTRIACRNSGRLPLRGHTMRQYEYQWYVATIINSRGFRHFWSMCHSHLHAYLDVIESLCKQRACCCMHAHVPTAYPHALTVADLISHIHANQLHRKSNTFHMRLD